MAPSMLVATIIGVDWAARAELGERVIVVGRAAGADLLLVDPAVSRRHLEARVVGDRVELRLLPGASPMLYRGEPASEVTLASGDHVLIGSTVLTVDAPAARSEAKSDDASATAIGGFVAEVRGFSSVLALVSALEGADDPESIDEVVGAWAKTHVGAASIALEERSSCRAPETVATAEGCVVRVPVSEAIGVALAFHLPRATVDDRSRALMVVCGRVLAPSLAQARARRAVQEEALALRTLAVGSARDFLGESAAAAQTARLLHRLAASDAIALLSGESGTGKTFAARLVHEAGPRASQPFRVINCAAIPENLLETELFGSERGAFSGAISRAGAFEAAGAGTLLLDEIGELAPPSQAKLLRVLEERAFERVGSNRTIPVRARVLAATNRDLAEMTKEGKFRRDLFFRISVVTVLIPPLRERGDDLALLAERLLADLASGAGRRIRGFDASALDVIRGYSWPGNVRELRNAIEHALVLGDGPTVRAEDLPASLRAATTHAPRGDASVVSLPANLAWLEERAIEAALAATGGNKTRAAGILGINRVTLQKKLRKDPG